MKKQKNGVLRQRVAWQRASVPSTLKQERRQMTAYKRKGRKGRK
jgi:hypothetical protein